MSRAFFSFADVHAARVAAERLRQCGVPAADIGVHAHVAEGEHDALGALLHRVFDPRNASTHARTYADEFARGAAVVSVRIVDDAQQPQIERLMESVGSTRRTAWLALRAT